MEEIYSGSAGEGPGKYAERLAAIDVDGDGKIDLLAGNYWFKYEQGGHFRPIKIADVGGRIAAGRFIKGATYPQVVINSGDGVAPLKWYECRDDPEDSKSWIGHDLVGRDEARVADLDGDGLLDVLDKPYNWETPRVDIWLQIRGHAQWADARRAPE